MVERYAKGTEPNKGNQIKINIGSKTLWLQV